MPPIFHAMREIYVPMLYYSAYAMRQTPFQEVTARQCQFVIGHASFQPENSRRMSVRYSVNEKCREGEFVAGRH